MVQIRMITVVIIVINCNSEIKVRQLTEFTIRNRMFVQQPTKMIRHDLYVQQAHTHTQKVKSTDVDLYSA